MRTSPRETPKTKGLSHQPTGRRYRRRPAVTDDSAVRVGVRFKQEVNTGGKQDTRVETEMGSVSAGWR
ncbi:hypothetical protein GCM10022251_79640 [Phytohabitans flavus]